jgi:hypothetical protein
MEVSDRKGLSFLVEVRRAFPLEKTEQIPLEVVLQRLETIDPGFVEWSKSLER